jgi:hypothetical protein
VSAKHTPGPWAVRRFGSKLQSCEITTDDSVQRIAILAGSRPEDAENAMLIAAAPDMFELLERIREALAEREDVVDDGPEQKPNWAMSLCLDIDVLLAKIDGVRL